MLGILVAVVVLYFFYLWIKAGAEQWDKWDRAVDGQKIKPSALLPSKWLADTYQPVQFWTKYYRAYYGV